MSKQSDSTQSTPRTQTTAIKRALKPAFDRRVDTSVVVASTRDGETIRSTITSYSVEPLDAATVKRVAQTLSDAGYRIEAAERGHVVALSPAPSTLSFPAGAPEAIARFLHANVDAAMAGQHPMGHGPSVSTRKRGDADAIVAAAVERTGSTRPSVIARETGLPLSTLRHSLRRLRESEPPAPPKRVRRSRERATQALVDAGMPRAVAGPLSFLA